MGRAVKQTDHGGLHLKRQAAPHLTEHAAVQPIANRDARKIGQSHRNLIEKGYEREEDYQDSTGHKIGEGKAEFAPFERRDREMERWRERVSAHLLIAPPAHDGLQNRLTDA